MNAQKNSLWLIMAQVMPWFVLAILLFYTYAKFFGHPYGFRWDSSGMIIYVFDKQPEPTLREGDRIIQIGPLHWDEFRIDLRKTFFEGVKPTDVVPIVVERNGETLIVPWTYPGFNQSEFLERTVSLFRDVALHCNHQFRRAVSSSYSQISSLHGSRQLPAKH